MKQTESVLKNPLLWISGVIMGACYVFGAIPDIRHSRNTDFLYFLEVTTGIGIVVRAAPLLTVLAYGLQFCKEWENGYYRMKIMRAGRLRYWLGHVLRAYLSGCLVVATAILIFVFTGIAVRGEFGIQDGMAGAREGSLFANLVGRGKGGTVFAIKVTAQILVGGLWPVLALAVSTFFRNQYVPLLFPFGACLMMEILSLIFQNGWITPVLLYYQSYQLFYMADNGTVWIFGEIGILLIGFALLLFWGIDRRLRRDG